MKRKDWIVLALFAATNLTLAFLPGIPKLSAWVSANDSKEATDTLLMVGGLQATCILVYLGISLGMHAGTIREAGAKQRDALDQQDRTLQELKPLLAGKAGQRIRPEDFYQSFLESALEADSHVCISYFAPFPPEIFPDTARKKYYEEINKLPKKNKKSKVYRIVRYSERNERWIGELITAFEGCANATLAVLRDASQADGSTALSIQVIDDQVAWLVATRGHEGHQQFRDMAINDAVIAAELFEYYKRLLDLSDSLVQNGSLTPAGQQFRNMLREKGEGAARDEAN